MGKLDYLNNSTSSMDIDPRPSTWNTLCPTYIDARRTKLLQDQATGHAIGSPPPQGPPKVMWNEPGAPNDKEDADLSSKIQDMRLQQPQPMIICEMVEDARPSTTNVAEASAVSLSVPQFDLANEKKRPPY